MENHLSGVDFDHILFSYHGLPERHLKKIDPTGKTCGNYESCCGRSRKVLKTCYRAQCFATTNSIAMKMNIPREKYSVGFQSRLGKEVWIPPYSDEIYVELAKKGVKKLAVACPSFTADCLETLEEVAMEGRETFLDAGGEEFYFVPCLNYQAKWVQASANLVRRVTHPSMAQAVKSQKNGPRAEVSQ